MKSSPRFQQLSAALANPTSDTIPELVALARSGDPHACLTLGEFRLLGMHGDADLRDGYRLIKEAGKRGLIDAQRVAAYLTAKGLGCAPDFERGVAMLAAIAANDRFSAIQLEFLKHVRNVDQMDSIERTIVSEDPSIIVFHNLFSAEECRYLETVKAPFVSPAVVGSALRIDPARDADCALYGPLTEDLVVQRINQRIAAASKTDVNWGEPLAIIRYRPGQQYHPHHDAVGVAEPERRRQLTALIWLNDAYDGGETEFPDLGVAVRGAVGDMILFRNVTAALDPDPRMVHAGRPVLQGVKWLASRWIRSSNYYSDSNAA